MTKQLNKNFQSGPASRQGGQAMLIAVIFFLFISTTVVLGIALPILRYVKSTQDAYASRESYFGAQSAIEDITYRLGSNKQVGSTETLSLNGGFISTTVTTN